MNTLWASKKSSSQPSTAQIQSCCTRSCKSSNLFALALVITNVGVSVVRKLVIDCLQAPALCWRNRWSRFTQSLLKVLVHDHWHSCVLLQRDPRWAGTQQMQAHTKPLMSACKCLLQGSFQHRHHHLTASNTSHKGPVRHLPLQPTHQPRTA